VPAALEDAELAEPRAFAEHLQARLVEFPADQARQGAADQPRDDGEHHVEDADILVVRRAEPSDQERRPSVRKTMAPLRRRRRHLATPSSGAEPRRARPQICMEYIALNRRPISPSRPWRRPIMHDKYIFR